MCNCKDWVRCGEETQGGKYPRSEHHPRCEDFKTERFVIIVYDGTACIVEPEDAEALIGYSVGYGFSMSDVMLTRDQFENIPDIEEF